MPTTKKRSYDKPLTHVIDDQIKKGGTWDEITANVNRVASRRDMWTPYKKGDIKWHIKKRLEKDPNYFGGDVKMDEEGVQVN